MSRDLEPLRVLHATECLAAGTLQVMCSLSAALAARGAEQTVVYSLRDESPSQVASIFPAGVRLIEVARASGTHFAFIRDLAQALRRECRHWQPHHVHLHSSKAGFVGRLALRGVRPSPRVLYSPHGLAFVDPSRPLANSVYRMLERIADGPEVTAVACGHGEGQLLERLTGRRAAVLENPVDQRFFEVAGNERMGSTVVTVGRISRQKGPALFAKVAATVRGREPTVRMVWVGDGDADGRAELQASGCEVTGWVTRDEVVRWMDRADVYLQTSLWEGLPVSVLQAMASGLPSVVTDVVGNRDAVQHGYSGLVGADAVALASAIQLLLADAQFRSDLGRRARDDASRRFGKETFSAMVDELYQLPAAVHDTPRGHARRLASRC